jgi:hypothetical protein
MRKLTDHIVEGDSANHQIVIGVMDEPGQGGACHLYQIHEFNTETNVSKMEVAGLHPNVLSILFQNGPIKEVGVNGVTHEALIAICIDRLRSFQTGPFACEANQQALYNLEIALGCLQKRTRDRIARGVEGSHQA